MCFAYDYDWYAEISEQSAGVAQEGERCAECRRDLVLGEPVQRVYQQQHEECHRCYDGECDCPEGGCCACAEPDFGETFEYQRCQQCDDFLTEVEAAEVEAGCARSEARPPLGELLDALRDGGLPAAARYFRHAAEHRPHLRGSGHLHRLWAETFHCFGE